MTALFPVTLEGAATRRRGRVLVGPLDLSLDGAGPCVVLGPNGAGKTTLLKLMHGIARLNEGRIAWACGTEAARNRQAFVFQRPVMLRRSVADNLAYPLRRRGVSRRDARLKAEKWAESVGLIEMLDRQAPVLSGGEQQKLAIARALITEPELVFLDEPTASLDGHATREIETILKSSVTDGTKLILATHDMGQARRLGDQVVFMLGGRVHEHGSSKAFFEGPSTPEAAAFLKGDIVE